MAVGASNQPLAGEAVRQLPPLVLLVLLAAALAYAGGPLVHLVERQRSTRSTASRARVTDA
ncbi:MAG: hypothetical protein ABJA93_10615 [Sporichthyaceae bacterium]